MEIPIDAILEFITNSKIDRQTSFMHLLLYGIINRTNIFGGVYYNSPIAFIVTAIITGSACENNCSTKIINALLFDAILMPLLFQLLRYFIKDKPAVNDEKTFDIFIDYMMYMHGILWIFKEIYHVTVTTYNHTMYQYVAFTLRRWLQGIIVTMFSKSIINDTIRPILLESAETELPQTCTSKYQLWSAGYKCVITDMVLGIIIIASDIGCEITTSMYGVIWLTTYTVIRLVALLSKSNNILVEYNLVSLFILAEVSAKQMKLHFPFTNHLTSTSTLTEFRIKNSPTTHSLQANGNSSINDIQIQIETSEGRSNVTTQQTHCYATQQCHMSPGTFPRYWHRHASSSLRQKYCHTWWQNSTTSTQYPDALQQCPDVLQQHPAALQQSLYSPLQPNCCFTQPDASLVTSNKAISNAVSKQLTYAMKSSPRGIGVIINNEKFNALQPRFGAAMDVHNLEILFQYLNFDTQSHKNKTHTEMRQILNDVAGMDHDKYDCLMVAILTHGDYGDVLYGTSGGITIQEVIETFSSKRCPTLISKPKIFIIQACRGRRYNQAVELDDGNDEQCDMIDSGPTVHPNISDYLVAYSTIPGHVSFRNNNNGSIFISTLVKIFRQHAASEDIITMLERVNNEVTKYQPQGNISYQDSRQSPEWRSSLRGKVFFNPCMND